MNDDLRAASPVDRAAEILARCMSQGMCGAGGCADCDCSGQVPHEARAWAQALDAAGVLAVAGDGPLRAATDHSTDQGHADAWADTHTGHTVHKGWHLECLWCDYTAKGRTRAEVQQMYHEQHEEPILARLRAALEGTT